jgi:hypothetical protein
MIPPDLLAEISAVCELDFRKKCAKWEEEVSYIFSKNLIL